ncbi:membrane magnesium transporter-domain-containing protein [Halteromyces radiatus]|uniref:membrane magnesium transporter-domain-containing protein n=1 Tax=Halteromyces radiatus TaxID=101107 RepID=UPI0022201D3C|nr:membrane magnesium transporter-domain-containing protein [Halteromyces radiatus]KAI8079874.1 membrane magnesium transporter-domain-containing protein [Halteromyces radiatus]
MSLHVYTGKAIALIGSLFLCHAAFSTYEHLAYLKATDHIESSLPLEIVVECLCSALIALVGVILSTDPFKNILMENEIVKMTIDKIDTRPSFITFHHRKVVSTMAQLQRKL